MMETSAHTIDLAIIIAYFVMVVFVGIRVGRNVNDARDYFLAGKSLAWWVVGFSIIATNLSVGGYIGASGGAYNVGIAQANFEWIGAIPAMVLACFIFIPLYWRAGVYSIPEYLGLRYNPTVRVTAAMLSIIMAIVGTGVSLWAIALTLETYLGWPIWVGIVVTATIVGTYSVFGGLAAVAFTDAAQVMVMFGGGVVLLVIGLTEVGGLGQLIDNVRAQEPSHFSAYLAADHPEFAWPGVLLGLGLVLSPAYWIGSQAILQRTLGARSEWDASAAMMLAALAKLFIPLLIVFPGFLALSLYAEIDYADQALPWVITHVLPVGLSGLMFVAIVAALQSTLDSSLNATALLVTRDIRHTLMPDADRSRDLVIGRGVTLGALLLGVCVTPLVSTFGGIYLFLQTALSLFQGPMLALLLFGALTRSATPMAAVITLFSGVAFASVLWFTGMNAFYIALFTFITACLVMAIASRLTQPKAVEEIAHLTYRGQGR